MAVVTTDGWRGDLTAISDRWRNVIKERISEALHWHILNLKIWVRDIHHDISWGHLQFYYYKFNFSVEQLAQAWRTGVARPDHYGHDDNIIFSVHGGLSR